jgi:hypothetical protein
MFNLLAADNLGYKLSDLSDANSFTQEKEFGAKVNVRFPFSVIDGQKEDFVPVSVCV